MNGGISWTKIDFEDGRRVMSCELWVTILDSYRERDEGWGLHVACCEL